MRRAALLAAVILAGCSGGPDLNYSTEGVIAPAGGCVIDPRSFGDAEALGTYGEGICTVRDAYRITSVSGVQFSQPAIINCAMANGVKDWLAAVVQPAARSSPVVRLDVAASYACRPRNGRNGAKLSEHGFGNAIDFSGVTFANGSHLDVAIDYYRSAFLKRIRTDGCGIFRTVLGPGSDSSHRNHIHFDLANRKSGQFCQ